MLRSLEQHSTVEEKENIKIARVSLDDIYKKTIEPKDVVYKNKYIGDIDYYNPIFGRCLKCASKKIASLRQIESESGGTSIIVCGGCGTRGEISFHKCLEKTKSDYLDDFYRYNDNVPNYLTYSANNRGYDCTIRNDEEVRVRDENVIVGGLQKIMTLDWLPVIWQKRESLRPGIYMFDIEKRNLKDLKSPSYKD
jgi:transcription elongation factor Elf1